MDKAMDKEKLCEVCGKNEASEVCHQCGIALCFKCVKDVNIVTTNPGQVIAGITTSALNPAERKIKVCPECVKKGDYF